MPGNLVTFVLAHAHVQRNYFSVALKLRKGDVEVPVYLLDCFQASFITRQIL